MPQLQKLMQPSFTGGELSPSLHSRLDLAKFTTGLKKAKNFIVHAHGGVSNRAGLEYCATQKEIPGIENAKIRVVPFEHSSEVSYCLEFGHNYVRVLHDGGLVLDGLVPLEVVTPYPHNKLADLKFIQSVDVLFIFHPEFPIKKLVHYAANDWRIESFVNINGPFHATRYDSNLGFNPYPEAFAYKDVEFFAASADRDNIKLNDNIRLNQFYKARNETKSMVVWSDGSSVMNLDIFTTAVKGEWYIKTNGTWRGKVTIFLRDERDGTWDLYRSETKVTSANETFNFSGYSEDFQAIWVVYENLTGVTYSGLSLDCKLECGSFYHSGLAKCILYPVNPLDPMKFKAINSFELRDEASGGPSYTWQVNSWCDRYGYPSCGEFYQDRFAAGGTEAEPHAVWFSQTGDYVNFASSDPIRATDSFPINMPSRKMNKVRNLISLRDIVAFTQASECSISDGGGGFSPTTAKTSQQGYRGSSKVAPVVIGNRAIMVQAMGSVVRDFGYEYASDGFNGEDLTIFSAHLFKGHKIVEMSYQQEPDSLVWVIRSDGVALSMTYMKEQEVKAWSWHETQGKFESVCTIPGGEQNDVYFVVERFGKRFIERMNRRMDQGDLKTAFFVDSGLSYNGAPTSTLSGLDHLEGKEVVALCDTRVVRGLIVEGGMVQLPEEASVIHIGLSYECDLQTLKLQFQSEVGNSHNDFVAISKVVMSFNDTRGGHIGSDENYLDPVIDLMPEDGDLGAEKKLYNGEYEQSIDSQFERGSSIFYRQSDPLPVSILAIAPVVSNGGY